MRTKILIIFAIVLGYIFMPSAVFLIFGMLPTIAAFGIDKNPGKSKTICVGAMNFAGCFPFLLQMHSEFGRQSVESALLMIADVQTIIIIYIIAAGGYAIDSTISGITSTLLIQKAESRLDKIRKQQNKLVKKWGEKVTGLYKLDAHGFPVNPDEITRKSQQSGAEEDNNS